MIKAFCYRSPKGGRLLLDVKHRVIHVLGLKVAFSETVQVEENIFGDLISNNEQYFFLKRGHHARVES